MSGLDTHTHTHTQDDYRNPRCACAPRVNHLMIQQKLKPHVSLVMIESDLYSYNQWSLQYTSDVGVG